jgi:hypothetical protein
MSNTITYTINLNGNMQKGVIDLADATERATGKIDRLVNAANKVANIGLAVQSVIAVYQKFSAAVSGVKSAYNAQMEAETKLAAVMRNTMSAGDDAVKSILDLTAAQQKLGVIGDEVQLAGAQELATYLEYPDSLQKIIPVMNDMLAQQYGLNASQEQAAQISTMLGKVMQGQTGALSRYGYGFTAAQEKILKTGTEAQRAAVLFDVVSESVGGVNAALAQTPAGKLKQHANEMGDLQERVGGLVIAVESAFLPVMTKAGELMNRLVSFFEKNRSAITGVADVIAGVLAASMQLLWTGVKFVWNAFTGLVRILSDLLPIIAAVGTAVLAYLVTANWQFIVFTVRYAAYIVATKAAAIATKIWTGVQWLLNAAITANPVGLLVAGIVILIAIIAYVCYKTEGWGSLWEGVVGFMKNAFFSFVESIKLYWSTLVNGIMTGLDKIVLGWYKFKEAAGMGDSSENRAAIARINADVEERQRAIVDGVKKVHEYAGKARESLSGIKMSWNSEKSLSDIAGGVKKKLGIGTNEGVQAAVNGPLNTASGGGSGGGDASKSNKAVATGGTRNTTVNISVGKFFESMVFNGGVRESKEDVQRQMAEVMARVLGMAENSV